jgi:signal transduction histidine kinase
MIVFSRWTVALLALLAVCAGGARAAATADDPKKAVLILLPGQPGPPAATLLAAGVRADLVSAWQTDVSIETEVMGRGIVGGSLIDLEAVGREAGQLALHALRGEPLPPSPVGSAGTNALLFDWRQLRRWGLEGRPLPVGSPVLYRSPTLWEQYRWYMVGTVLLVAAQGGLIVGLLVERRRRRRAQERLAARLRFEALMADVSAAFAASPAAQVDGDIRECLRRIVDLLGVDRGTLWQPSRDGEALVATHSWYREGGVAPPGALATSAFPLARALERGPRSLSFSSPDELPPEATAERRAFEQLGVRSLLAVPLQIGERRLGILAFASLRGRRAWPAAIVQQVTTLGEVFANALMRKDAAAALQMSEALGAAVLTALPGEAAIVDGDGVVVRINAAWAALGRADGHDPLLVPALGESYLDERRRAVATLSEDGRGRAIDLVASVVQGRRDDGAIEYALRRHGAERWFELRVQRLARPARGAAVMHLDVTARKRAEVEAQRHLREVAHMNRVAAMGELASSLAHELNQPLTAILSNAQAATQFLAAPVPDLAEVRDCLGDIVKNDRRAGEVIRRMRRMLQKGAGDLSPMNLNDLVQGVLGLVASDALLQQVTVELAAAPALPSVRADPVQIQQVVLNLLLNAIAAAAGSTARPGLVTVRTELADEAVAIEVRDSGPGIASADLERIFEPFVTTKRDGLGMGLAISRSIVEAHRGRIWAESPSGGGAVFRVHLPVVAEPSA